MNDPRGIEIKYNAIHRNQNQPDVRHQPLAPSSLPPDAHAPAPLHNPRQEELRLETFPPAGARP